MKKLLIILCAMCFMLSFACTQSFANTIRLKFAHGIPPKSSMGVALEKYAQKVGENSQGKLEVKIYGGGTLMKAPEFYDAVVNGVADIAFAACSHAIEHFRLELGLNLPALGWKTTYPELSDEQNRVRNKLIKLYPQIEKGRKDVVILYYFYASPYIISSTKKEIKKPEDLKGLKIGSIGWALDLVKVLGGTPVAVPPPGRYMALDRGVVDGTVDMWSGGLVFKLHEVNRYYLDGIQLGNAALVVIMNRKKYESLPSELKDVIQATNQYGYDVAIQQAVEFDQKAIKAAEDAGRSIHIANEEEANAWNELSLPYQEDWVKQLEKKGLPGKQFLEDTKRLIAEGN